jgi:hypothetical protein
MTLELFPTEPPGALSVSYTSHPVCEEMLAFLASGPSPERIVAFKISSATQRRLGKLLDKNREEGLTPEETAELDVYTQVYHLLLLLKARARLAASAPAVVMPSIYIPAAVRRRVMQRAQERCEYCLLHQVDVPFAHHIDHIIPRKHGGLTASHNL